MIDITPWMDGFLKALNDTFGNRVWFVGLQGSYGRGEASDTSDIDVIVTDVKPPEGWRERFKATGTECIYPEE